MLAFYLTLSVAVSFICSMLEAVILSVTPSYLESLRKPSPDLYEKFKLMKDDIERPLASILTFNTIAHTVGAAGAGAEAQRIFGNEALAVFSAILTFVILFFSEIIPKSIGASFWKPLLPFAVNLLRPMIVLSLPIVWMSERISSIFKKGPVRISREEIAATTDIGFSDGILSSVEHRAIKGLIEFRKLDILSSMTPVEKVKMVKQSSTYDELLVSLREHTFSRIIVYGYDENDLKGFFLRVRFLHELTDGKEIEMQKLVNPILTVDSSTKLSHLFYKLIDRHEHIAAIIDAEGKFLGIVTLEDIFEKLLGLDIFDEQDLKGSK